VEVRLVFLEQDQHGFSEVLLFLIAHICHGEFVAEVLKASLDVILDDLVEVIGDLEVNEVNNDEHAQEERVISHAEHR